MTDVFTIKILLADDDKDDCLLFKDALGELPLSTSLTTVNDGERLMQHLQIASANLPHVLFLDLNLPRKNGFECLTEIKKHSLLKKIPVVIYSTSYDERMSNQLFDSGAHYYICKPADYEELKKVIHRALLFIMESYVEHGTTTRPPKERFLINKIKTPL